MIVNSVKSFTAFGTVNLQILLQKLYYYVLRGIALKWFESYLASRHQSVATNGYTSNPGEVICGAPQGSVLGPLLFIIYTNDLPNVSEHLSIFLLADDTNIKFESDDTKTFNHIINRDEVELAV